MGQCPELSSSTSEAQASHPAREPRPCQPHGSEEKGGKRKEGRKEGREGGRKKKRKERQKRGRESNQTEKQIYQ